MQVTKPRRGPDPRRGFVHSRGANPLGLRRFLREWTNTCETLSNPLLGTLRLDGTGATRVDVTVVQLLRDHPRTIALVAIASALVGSVVTAIAAQVVHVTRTKQLTKEIVALKELRARRIEEFARLAPRPERAAPSPPPPIGGDADVTDKLRADRSD